MIPSKNWFPTNLQDRAAWYENFNIQAQGTGASLGLTVAEIATIADDNSMIEFLASAAVFVEAFDDGVRQFRRVVTEGDIGDVAPVYPTPPITDPPVPAVTGIFERLDGFVKRIRVAPAYTDEIGATFGIIPAGGGGPDAPVGDVPPVLKASVEVGNIVEVKFVKNGSDGIYIETRVDGSDWAFTKVAVKSPGIFTVPANTGNTPRGVEIRARYLDGNSPVGVLSDTVNVQTIP